mmetsp:Transcript_34712/g.92691  ORF Transcript_34712/g.92691 Transcript_34712/m.92691 type:complete len:238 (-) Transcript_34712:12-725(-)
MVGAVSNDVVTICAQRNAVWIIQLRGRGSSRAASRHSLTQCSRRCWRAAQNTMIAGVGNHVIPSCSDGDPLWVAQCGAARLSKATGADHRGTSGAKRCIVTALHDMREDGHEDGCSVSVERNSMNGTLNHRLTRRSWGCRWTTLHATVRCVGDHVVALGGDRDVGWLIQVDQVSAPLSRPRHCLARKTWGHGAQLHAVVVLVRDQIIGTCHLNADYQPKEHGETRPKCDQRQWVQPR